MPDDNADEMAIEQVGDEYALVRTKPGGERSEIILSEANIAFLNRLLPTALQKILAKQSSPNAVAQGIVTDLFVPVSRMRSGPDLHHQSVLLTMYDMYGNKTAYALDLGIAKPLIDALKQHVAEIEAAVASRNVQ